jgi:cobalt-precorrin 5A hydrolase
MVSETLPKPPEASLAIVALTRSGVSLALQIQTRLPGAVCYVPRRHRFAVALGARGFDRLAALVPELWRDFRSLAFIMATGIVVRLIAPLLKHKRSDPAVVVLDERGHHVISLLAGHMGGANHLAGEIARITGGQAVITTASDVAGRPAIDLIAERAGLVVENPEMLARVARAVVEQETVRVYDPGEHLKPFLHGEIGFSWCGCDALQPACAPGGVLLWVAATPLPAGVVGLHLRPRDLVVGVGCNRGTSTDEVMNLLERVFEEHGLSTQAIRNFATVDLKAGEPGILELGRKMNRPVQVFARAEIADISVPNPSAVVRAHLGVESVCEATALVSAQSTNLIVPKQKSKNATMAVARVASPL